MNELEKLRADLKTLKAAAEITYTRASTQRQIEEEAGLIKQRIAAFESEQSVEPDPWEEAKKVFERWSKMDLRTPGRTVVDYVRHLEAELAKLDEELRCERIDGGKVLDQSKEIIDELKARLEGERIAFSTMADHAAELLKERDEARAELAKRPVKSVTLDHLREKLAELTTIYNAIPPACPEAQALVQARIEAVKQEMQGNE